MGQPWSSGHLDSELPEPCTQPVSGGYERVDPRTRHRLPEADEQGIILPFAKGQAAGNTIFSVIKM
jgi:hypothetical protein